MCSESTFEPHLWYCGLEIQRLGIPMFTFAGLEDFDIKQYWKLTTARLLHNLQPPYKWANIKDFI